MYAHMSYEVRLVLGAEATQVTEVGPRVTVRGLVLYQGALGGKTPITHRALEGLLP